MLSAYIRALTNWSPRGRSHRRDFWLFWLPHVIIIVALFSSPMIPVFEEGLSLTAGILLIYVVATA